MINIEELKELRPGDLISVISRKWDSVNQRLGEPDDVFEFTFMAYIHNYVVASKINFLTVNEEMEYSANDTAEIGSTRFLVFPVQDCYMRRVDAIEQMKRENGIIYDK